MLNETQFVHKCLKCEKYIVLRHCANGIARCSDCQSFDMECVTNIDVQKAVNLAINKKSIRRKLNVC